MGVDAEPGSTTWHMVTEEHYIDLLEAVAWAARQVIRLSDDDRFAHYRIMSNDGAKAMLVLEEALWALAEGA